MHLQENSRARLRNIAREKKVKMLICNSEIEVSPYPAPTLMHHESNPQGYLQMVPAHYIIQALKSNCVPHEKN